MYDTMKLDFEYSNDGKEFNILALVYIEENSVLFDRQYKDSNDAIATQRIRYNDVEDVSIEGSCILVKYSEGLVYLKNNDSEALKEFYGKLVEFVN